MIVSALLTSVGINLGFSVALFALYSLLRKQPANLGVYAPRLVAADGGVHRNGRFSLDFLLPSAGWVRKAWQQSEDELLASCGLDAVVFDRIFVFNLQLLSVAMVLGIFILLPVNYLGDHLQDIDFSNIPSKSLDLFTISNVNDGSNMLWFHFSATYVITGVACYLLFVEYKHISEKRIAVFNASKPKVQDFTILVRDIPIRDGITLSDSVEGFFKEYHPSTYLSHVVVRRTNKLRDLMADAENIYKKITHLKSNPDASEQNYWCCFGLFGKNDLLDRYAKKLEDLEEHVRLEQSDTSLRIKEVPAAFVCFKSRYGAAEAIRIQQSVNPTEWVTEQAPEPQDVHWPFFSTSFAQRWISKLVVLVASVLLVVVFLAVVAFVQGLTYMEQLEILLPFLKNILKITAVSQIVTGYLPSLILNLLSSLVPGIMKIFSAMQGFISVSEIEKSACYKMLLFTIWILFFANVLTGGATSLFSILADPKNIPARLAVVVPGQASFFIAYVVTSWTSLSWELNRTVSLVYDFIRRQCCRSKDVEIQIPSIPYHSEIPRILLFQLLGLTYFVLAPLILPFVLVYMCMGYIIYRNQLLNVFLPKYETGGAFWPIVHNSTIFSLILMQIIAIGMFGLKKLPSASSLILPLPILTLLFNDYCRKCFRPIFSVYSAQTLISKDREDQNDPSMEEFFNKLVTAYADPALMPTQRSRDANDSHSPLLSSRGSKVVSFYTSSTIMGTYEDQRLLTRDTTIR